MNHLMRELAPVTEDAWTQIDEEAARSIKWSSIAIRKAVSHTAGSKLVLRLTDCAG